MIRPTTLFRNTTQIFRVLNKRTLFNYRDPFLLETQLSDNEVSIKDVAHDFSKEYLLPNVVSAFRNETFDKKVMKEMGNVGL